MSMDGALYHLRTSFSSLEISSSQFLQVDKLGPSNLTSSHGSFHSKNVHLLGALIVGPLRAVRDNCRLSCTRKSAKHRFAKDDQWAGSINMVRENRWDVFDSCASFHSNDKVASRVGCLRKDLSSQREEYANLEFEILKFMESSDKPLSFPSKSELVKAGRADLVDAILAKGGWLVSGWDTELENNEKVQRLDVSRMGTNARPIQEAPKLSTGENSSLGSGVGDENTNGLFTGFKKRKGRHKSARNEASVASSPTIERFQEEENLVLSKLGTESQGHPSLERFQDKEDLVLSKLGTESQDHPSLNKLSGLTDRMVGWKKVAKLFGLAEYVRKSMAGEQLA